MLGENANSSFSNWRIQSRFLNPNAYGTIEVCYVLVTTKMIEFVLKCVLTVSYTHLVNKQYPIVNMVHVDTRYGKSVLVTLEDGELRYREYLPKRYACLLYTSGTCVYWTVQ